MTMREMVLRQITSGRWLLTMAAAISLLALVRADLLAIGQDKEPPVSTEALFSIITMVFVSYFNRTREPNGEGNGKGKGGNGSGDEETMMDALYNGPKPPKPQT